MKRRGLPKISSDESDEILKSPQINDSEFQGVLLLVQAAKVRSFHAVNAEMITLYWQVGEYISRKVLEDGWGRGTIQNLGAYLQRVQPGLRGFSAQNLWRMRQFYQAYSDPAILSSLLRELPWTHHMIILGRAKTQEERAYYMAIAVRERWSSRELQRQFDTCLFVRQTIEPIMLSPALREIQPKAEDYFKNTYSLEFLGLPAEHTEADLEAALLRNLGRFITELGRDFCFIGSQFPIQVGSQDFLIDMLFFHRGMNCLVAIELKIREFRPEDLGKVNFYLEALDRDVRKAHENPAVGLLLCATKDSEVVEYCLSRSLSPALVAEYETLLPDKRLLKSKLQELYRLCAFRESDVDG